jgi:hypothetical protein
MSDSLLVEALDDTRNLLDEIEDDDGAAARTLRIRVEILDRATASLHLRPTRREQVVRLAQMAMQVRDDAVELRRHHRSVQQIIQKMMD